MDTVTLQHTFGSLKRSGEWEVPARLVLRQRMGSTSLDFTDATFAGAETELEIDMVGGSIEIRVPADMRVTADIATTLASYQDHRSETVSPSGRTLTIRGRAVWGSVEVRGPRKSGWKKS